MIHNSYSSRGTALFSTEALEKVFEQTIAPELDDTHHLVAVGTLTKEGAKAAIIYHRPVTVIGLKGEWQIESAFLYNWTGEHDAEAPPSLSSAEAHSSIGSKCCRACGAAPADLVDLGTPDRR